MPRHTTVYLYELAWMLPSVAIPVGHGQLNEKILDKLVKHLTANMLTLVFW